MIADDHPIVRSGLRTLLQRLDGIEIVAEAGDGEEALRLSRLHKPEVLLLDISMPKLGGLEVASQIASNGPATRVIMLSVHANDLYVRRTLNAGAAGYLCKDTDKDELEQAIATVMRGGHYLAPSAVTHLRSSRIRGYCGPKSLYETLTQRQREVLQLVAEGCSTRDIACTLGISVKTVESHRTDLMSRLDITDIPGLVLYAIRIGLVRLDS